MGVTMPRQLTEREDRFDRHFELVCALILAAGLVAFVLWAIATS